MTLISQMNISEYDKRQLSLMKEMLVSYSNSKISLKKLIDNLEGLLNSLESIDDDWRCHFREHWFTLEQVYSVSLFRNEQINPADSDILEALTEINRLISS